jgi:hypothetical protein
MSGSTANLLLLTEPWSITRRARMLPRLLTLLQVRCDVKELLLKGEAWYAKVKEALAAHKQ